MQGVLSGRGCTVEWTWPQLSLVPHAPGAARGRGGWGSKAKLRPRFPLHTPLACTSVWAKEEKETSEDPRDRARENTVLLFEVLIRVLSHPHPTTNSLLTSNGRGDGGSGGGYGREGTCMATCHWAQRVRSTIRPALMHPLSHRRDMAMAPKSNSHSEVPGQCHNGLFLVGCRWCGSGSGRGTGTSRHSLSKGSSSLTTSLFLQKLGNVSPSHIPSIRIHVLLLPLVATAHACHGYALECRNKQDRLFQPPRSLMPGLHTPTAFGP
jgi:hypothetical protein